MSALPDAVQETNTTEENPTIGSNLPLPIVSIHHGSNLITVWLVAYLGTLQYRQYVIGTIMYIHMILSIN
jgi:hypothetical protein